jgi:hypothetical protein
MKMRYDCIAGYHLNYLTCGIAKFNLLLGRKMGVPFHNLYAPELDAFHAPLLSVKLAEFTPEDLAALPAWMDKGEAMGGYSVFLHGYDGTPLEDELLHRAHAVYCGNRALHERLQPLNPNTHSLWCPGTNMHHQVFERTELTVFSFGMAYKLKTEKYYRLKDLLEKTGKTYSILLSTALHEGTSFDESFIEVFNEMKGIFEDRVYFLGYLSDQAVYNYLRETDYFTAFFDNGLRANNTSVNTALAAGAVVISNLDEYSPAALVNMKNIIDINQVEELPNDARILGQISAEAVKIGTQDLGWDALVSNFIHAPE